MATLVELIDAEALFKYDAGLDGNQQEFREFYASPKLRNWIETTLPALVSSWNIELTPVEQFDALGAIFAAGDTLTFGWHFKPLTHIHHGIWELKTADLRVFGWFPRKDCFVGVVADETSKIKKHDLYAGYAGEVARFRDALALNEPKYLAGDSPNDVVSDWNYP